MNNPLLNKYKKFTESDFINDSDFQDWCISPPSQQNLFWENFFDQFPGKTEEIKNARAFLTSLQFQQDVPDAEYVHEKYLSHLQLLESQKLLNFSRFNSIKFRLAISIAATVIGIILISIIAVYFNNKSDSKHVISSNYGELKKILLADSSVIVLNAHSSITFNDVLKKNHPREIWLKGEAYFNIKHFNKNPTKITPAERMLVHGENFLLEVLGTSFDIRQRRNKTEVVLQSGKIALTFFDSLKTKVTLRPGDLVSYNSKNQQITRSTTIADNYVKWQSKNLILTNPTLEEIINYLEDNYGKKIILESPELKNKKIEGPIKMDNFNDALFIISTTLNIEIKKKGDSTILRSR